MNDEWQRIAGEIYVKKMIAKHKADGGRHTYDADCMAAALAAVAPIIAAAERERCAKVAKAWDKNRLIYDCDGNAVESKHGASVAAAIRAQGDA